MQVMQRLISALYPTPKGAGFTAHLIKTTQVLDRIFVVFSCFAESDFHPN